jgi:ABC-2 type transport system permease protein
MDMGSTFGSYIGLLFLIASYTAIGLFTSTLSTNQINAFIIAVILIFFLFYGIEMITKSLGNSAYFLQKLGVKEHYKSISKGVIDTRDIIYFTSITFFFLFITKQKLTNE